MVLNQIEQSRFRRLDLGYSINFKLYYIHEIDEALSHQKVFTKKQRGDADFQNVKL